MRRQPIGWLVLCIAMGALGLIVTLDAIWRIDDGARWPLVVAPVNLVFCYWVGAGAWRRTAVTPDPGQPHA